MAKSKSDETSSVDSAVVSDDAGVAVSTPEGASVPAVEVSAKSAEDSNDAYLRKQNEALMHYRNTGEVGVYVDPNRDQEPDIAPEIGVAPAPDLANPAPPSDSYSGRTLDTRYNAVVKSVGTKAEDSKDATEAFNQYVADREAAFQDNATGATPAGSLPSPDATTYSGQDESVKASQGDARKTV